MNAVVEHLPLPVGARFAAPVRRTRVDIWAAPDPAALVLDPWAAPVGLPVARTRLSPWAAPNPSARSTWMAAPAALLPPPVSSAPAVDDAAVATERAIASLRAFTSAPRTERVAAPAPVALTLEAAAKPVETLAPLERAEWLPPQPAADVSPADDTASTTATWRLVAMVSGAGLAVAAAVTLLTSVF